MTNPSSDSSDYGGATFDPYTVAIEHHEPTSDDSSPFTGILFGSPFSISLWVAIGFGLSKLIRWIV